MSAMESACPPYLAFRADHGKKWTTDLLVKSHRVYPSSEQTVFHLKAVSALHLWMEHCRLQPVISGHSIPYQPNCREATNGEYRLDVAFIC